MSSKFGADFLFLLLPLLSPLALGSVGSVLGPCAWVPETEDLEQSNAYQRLPNKYLLLAIALQGVEKPPAKERSRKASHLWNTKMPALEQIEDQL